VTHTSKNTALVLFTRSLLEESHVKDLFASHTKGAVLYRSLVGRVRKEAAFSRMDYFEFTSSKQCGNCFAEKLSNTYRHFFDLGYEKVILIGNDCPGLGIREFRKAEEALEKSGLIIGPTNLGGVYLIGCTKDFFETTFAIEEIAWNTDSVFGDFLNIHGEDLVLLKLQKELNGLKDLPSLVSQFSIYKHFKNLVDLFNLRDHFSLIITSFFSALFYSFLGLRGPPIMIQ